MVHSTEALDVKALNFIDGDQDMELNAAEDIPEYIEIDVAVDSGAGDHVLARVDAPGHPVEEPQAPSVGRNSRAQEARSCTMQGGSF